MGQDWERIRYCILFVKKSHDSVATGISSPPTGLGGCRFAPATTPKLRSVCGCLDDLQASLYSGDALYSGDTFLVSWQGCSFSFMLLGYLFALGLVVHFCAFLTTFVAFWCILYDLHLILTWHNYIISIIIYIWYIMILMCYTDSLFCSLCHWWLRQIYDDLRDLRAAPAPLYLEPLRLTLPHS